MNVQLSRGDMIVIAGALLLLPMLYLHYWGNASHGEQIVIRAAHQDAQYYSLYDDQQIHIAGPLGDSIIEIKDAQVRFIHSPCEGKQCIHTGWLNQDGQIAACLPNGVTVQVIGRDARFDAVNF